MAASSSSQPRPHLLSLAHPSIADSADSPNSPLSPRRRRGAQVHTSSEIENHYESVDHQIAKLASSTSQPKAPSCPLSFEAAHHGPAVSHSRSTSLANELSRHTLNLTRQRHRSLSYDKSYPSSSPRERLKMPTDQPEEQRRLLEEEKYSDTPDSSPSNDLAGKERVSLESATSASTTSLVLENLNANGTAAEQQETLVKKGRGKPEEPMGYRDDVSDPEIPPYYDASDVVSGGKKMSRNLKRLIWIVSVIAATGWGLALFSFLISGRHRTAEIYEYDHEGPMKHGTGKRVTLEQVQAGEWNPKYANVQWTDGPNGEDGLLLEVDQAGKDFLFVEDIRSRKAGEAVTFGTRTLMKSGYFDYDSDQYYTVEQWVSPDMKQVLLMTKKTKVWRHSYTGLYFIWDVEAKKAQPLDPANPLSRVQLAQWSPNGDAIVFTRNNNLFMRMMDSDAVRQITNDGGPEYFYGIPDWAYEEEVFATNKATWWSRDGAFVAFMRTNETMVPEYPVEYFIQRPSGKAPDSGLEAYPETRKIKYPKAGAPNPVVDMLFYDVASKEYFSVDVSGGFADDDRIITNVLWADNGQAIIQEANRESDHLRYVLVNVASRSGKTIRSRDLTKTDDGWVEPGQKTIYIPADRANRRPIDGFIDTAMYNNSDHLAYYTPVDNPEPIMLTSGDWEVDGGALSVDLANNLVYFISTAVSPTQRHLYSVKLDGSSLTPVTPLDPGYWSASFSSKSGYIQLTNLGPGIPFQKVVSAPIANSKFEISLEKNEELADRAKSHELPQLVYTNLTFTDPGSKEDYMVNILERRPPHFNPNKRYPVIFFQYSGPGSQTVKHMFHVDFQSYLASSLGYIVITVDPRGTGFMGLNHRKIIRGHLGRYEGHDQITAAQYYAKKKYVDEDRMAIWGWSFGGFTTLKALELDAGKTFKYGMAVAPVTDWSFYDSIYTERYMLTPQHNPDGYTESAINNVTALAQTTRFLVMHGTGDDNVHLQNTLTLLDKLDLGGVKNYDVHVFPDSDHSIYFHNANVMVYGRLSTWIQRAFNGDFERLEEGLMGYFDDDGEE